MTLILPHQSKTLDWVTLAELVDKYLYQLRQNGVPDNAVPPALQGVDAMDVWLGEVMNGGHSQFVGNSGDHAVPILRRALATAEACGVMVWAGLMRRAIDWIKGNSDEAGKLTGFTFGVSGALQELDRAFQQDWQKTEAEMVAGILALPGVRWVAPEAHEQAVRQEAQRLIATSPNLRRALTREVTLACHTFFSDAPAVALAMACHKAGVMVRNTQEPLPLGPERDVTFSLMLVVHGSPGTPAIIQVLDREGLRLQTEFPPARGRVLAEVTWAEVQLAQDMARALRLPELVGLMWPQTGRAFHTSWAFLRVLPGPLWARSRGGVGFGTKDWAVTANTQNLEFQDTLKNISQRLNARQLNALIEEAGL